MVTVGIQYLLGLGPRTAGQVERFGVGGDGVEGDGWRVSCSTGGGGPAAAQARQVGRPQTGRVGHVVCVDGGVEHVCHHLQQHSVLRGAARGQNATLSADLEAEVLGVDAFCHQLTLDDGAHLGVLIEGVHRLTGRVAPLDSGAVRSDLLL